MEWPTSASTSLGSDAVMHRCCRWRWPAAATIAKPTSDARGKLAGGEHQSSIASVRAEARPERTDPALNVR